MKERYILMRNSKTINNRWFWDYYKNKGGVLEDWNQFALFFQQSINVSELLHTLDKEYQLTTLFAKDGEFIKVVQ